MKIQWLLVLIMCIGLQAHAIDASSDLINILEKTQTFQAQFSQKIRDANGDNVGNTKGKVAISRPGKFYWKSQAPDEILVVSDGHNLWSYDIDLSQVTKQPLKETLKNSPAQLLAGKVSTLKNTFAITYAKPKQCTKNIDTCFQLHPKQKEASFSNIIIGFAKGKLTEIKMTDPLGQYVYTVFSEIKVNGPINRNLFAFTPPAGVDIIYSGNDHDRP